MRRFGITAFWLSVTAVLVTFVVGRPAAAVLQQQATPAAGTPAAPTEVVTITAWYTQDPTGEFLNLQPIATNAQFVARPALGTASGRVDFTGTDDELPRITIGDSEFDGYLVDSEDPDTGLRWRYLDNEDGNRPATVTVQVSATKGPYSGYVGMATFTSRARQAGGIMVVMLRPDTGGNEAAATEAAATEAAAAETPEQ